MHDAKYLPPTKVTYSDTRFHNDQASYFNTKVLVFAELGHIYNFLLTCVMIKSAAISVTTPMLTMHDLQF